MRRMVWKGFQITTADYVLGFLLFSSMRSLRVKVGVVRREKLVVAVIGPAFLLPIRHYHQFAIHEGSGEGSCIRVQSGEVRGNGSLRLDARLRRISTNLQG